MWQLITTRALHPECREVQDTVNVWVYLPSQQVSNSLATSHVRLLQYMYNSAQIFVRNKMIDDVAHMQEQACDKTLGLATDFATVVIGLDATACRICKSLQHKLEARQN